MLYQNTSCHAHPMPRPRPGSLQCKDLYNVKCIVLYSLYHWHALRNNRSLRCTLHNARSAMRCGVIACALRAAEAHPTARAAGRARASNAPPPTPRTQEGAVTDLFRRRREASSASWKLSSQKRCAPAPRIVAKAQRFAEKRWRLSSQKRCAPAQRIVAKTQHFFAHRRQSGARLRSATYADAAQTPPKRNVYGRRAHKNATFVAAKACVGCMPSPPPPGDSQAVKRIKHQY